MTWTSQFPHITQAMASKAGKAVQKAGRDVEAAAKTKAPVDTGNLRNSIQAQQGRSFESIITAQAEYAIYVEFGTHKMGAQPYMIPALHEVAPSFEAAMRSILLP